MNGKIKEISMKPWNYILYNVDGIYILTVTFCEQIVDYSLSYKLTEDEIKIAHDDSALSLLADKIRQDKDKFKYRQIIPTIMV